jgi:hypothetical protein
MANNVFGFSININGIQTIAELNEEIQNTQKGLAKLVVGTEEYAETSKKLAKLRAEQKALNKQQDDLNKSFLETTNTLGAYDKLSAKLNRLRKDYKDLAVSGKGSEKATKDLLKQIQELDTQLKETDASVGQFQRNVGNYGDAFSEVAGNLGGVGQFASQAVGGVRALGVAFKAALGPIGLIITAIGLVVGALQAFFNNSEEGQNTFRRLQAIVQVVLNNITDLFADLGKVLFDVFSNPIESLKKFGNLIKENITNRIVGLLEFIPQLGKSIGLLFQGEFQKAGQVALDAVAKVSLGIDKFTEKAQKGFGNIVTGLQNVITETNKEIQQQIKLSAIQDDLDKRARAALVENAKLQQKVADVKNKVAQTDKFNEEERLKLLDEGIAAEMQILKNNEYIAATKLKIKNIEIENGKKTKENLDEQAQLEAELVQIRTENIDKTAELLGQKAALIESIQTEKNETKKYIEEANKLQLEILDQTNKIITDLIQNEYIKRRQLAEDNYDADLKSLQDSIQAQREANEEKSKELEKKYGADSESFKNFQAEVAVIEAENVKQLENYRTERQKALTKELSQIETDQIAKQLEENKKLFDLSYSDRKNTIEKAYNEQVVLAQGNEKKLLELETQLEIDLYNLEKERIQKEIALNELKLSTVTSLSDTEKANIISQNVALNNSLSKLDAERTANAKTESDKRIEIEQQEVDKKWADLNEKIQIAGQFTQVALDTLTSFAEISDQKRMERLEKDAEANQQIQDNLNERLQTATGLERRYLEQQLEASVKNAETIAKQKQKLEKDAAKRKKATAVIESIINTALAVSSALATPPAPNVIAGVIAGIAGAAQTAVIAAQPLAKGGVVGKGDDIVQFANGGRVTSRGNIKPLSNGDNVLATLKTGEVVLNESQQRRIGYASLKRAQIPNFANGGLVGAPTSLISNANNTIASEQMRVNLMDEMVKATNQRIDRLTVVYTATTDFEVEKGRNDKKTIKANSTF